MVSPVVSEAAVAGSRAAASREGNLATPDTREGWYPQTGWMTSLIMFRTGADAVPAAFMHAIPSGGPDDIK